MSTVSQKQKMHFMPLLEMLLFADVTLLSILALSDTPYFFSDAFMKWLCELMGVLQNWQTLISSLIGVAIACLTFWLSIKRFHHEKWWTLKVEAYQRVIEALNYSKAFFMTYINYANRYSDEESEHKAKNSGDREKMENQIGKAIDLSELIISEEAKILLQNYQVQIVDVFNETWWPEQLEAGIAATEDCLKNLTKLAEKDLDKRL